MSGSGLIDRACAEALSDDVGARVRDLIDRGALFVVNHSAGKDSQAMHAVLRRLVPADQILVIHAELPEVDWEDNVDHIRNTAGDFPLVVTRAKKTFFEMVHHRGMFPSPAQRQCTSDLKRNPIEREIRRYLKENPRFGGLVVNCTGIRAAESASRAKQTAFRHSEKNSKAGREWHEWMPIHQLTELEVFSIIAEAGESAHWAYRAGMSRLSCAFCIMSSQKDLKTAAKLRPALYRRYVETEKELDRTMMMPSGGRRRFLEEITGIPADEADEAEEIAEAA